MEINVVPIPEGQLRALPESYGFGGVFANRMFMQRYDAGKGWHDAAITPYQAIALDPSIAALHYAQAIFEGCKAYRRPDGNVNLFRTWENTKRFNRSATRMAMPTVDEEDHLTAIVKLIEIEQEWVPNDPGSSLYIRPFMFASEAALGVHASHNYLHLVILSPVGSYFGDSLEPVAVHISDNYRRAVIGGTGDVKAAGNYAASLFVSERVKKEGYSQVLWLDAIHGQYVEEVGAMNYAVVYNGKHVVTPALTGSILPGITRNSLLRLAPDLGYTVSEEQIDVHDMLADIQSGEITEAFGCGTAAVVVPIGKLGFRGQAYLLNDNKAGPVTSRLYQALTDIQYGRIPDERDWTMTIKVK